MLPIVFWHQHKTQLDTIRCRTTTNSRIGEDRVVTGGEAKVHRSKHIPNLSYINS